MSDDYNRGVYYLATGWSLTALLLAAVSLRLYTRGVLTRSMGSDDLAIIVSTILTVFGECGDTIAVHYGLGQHSSNLTSYQISQAKKWEYINLITVFISFFFVRASVLLFVLRLLPLYKKWQYRVVYLLFFLSFAITVTACVTYGIRCIPFNAIYEDVPGAWCESPSVEVDVQWFNGIMSCVIDVLTALVPEMLLWRVQMKKSTKYSLYAIFGLGLIISGLSIGRVATSSTSVWEDDMTWRIIPSDMFSMVEEKLGITFASAPALRQLIVYINHHHTMLPVPNLPPPNHDFLTMRKRVNVRDIQYMGRRAESTDASYSKSKLDVWRENWRTWSPLHKKQPKGKALDERSMEDAQHSPVFDPNIYEMYE